MIVEVILNLFYTVSALALTPIQVVFSPMGSMAGLLELFSYASIFVPMSVFGACMGTWLAFQSVRLTFTVANWIIGKIPTID
jgi:hypothetical protein